MLNFQVIVCNGIVLSILQIVVCVCVALSLSTYIIYMFLIELFFLISLCALLELL